MTKYPVPQVLTTRDLPLPKPADLFVAGTIVGWYQKAEELQDRLCDSVYENNLPTIKELDVWLEESYATYLFAIKTQYEIAVQTLLVEIPTMLHLAENSQVIDWLDATYRLLEEVVKC